MNKIILIVIMTLFVSKISMAEDIINVEPFEAKAGALSEDAMCFQIEMVSSQDYWGVQFDLFLPEGMTLDTTGGLDPYDTELNENRYPYTVDRRGNKTYKHSVQWSVIDSGAYRFVISPDDNESFITSGDGEILTLYYLTDSGFSDGLHPFVVENSVLAISGNSGVRPVASSSYCVVGESQLKNDKYLDLSCLTGYLPSFVISKINEDLVLNKNLAEIDLTGITSAFGLLSVVNPNVLTYYMAETEVAEMVSDQDNMIVFDGVSYNCNSLLLNENYSFACSKTISVLEAKMDRSFCGHWNTICVPFSLKTSELQNLLGEYTYLTQLVGYSDNTFIFKNVGEESLPNIPYVFIIGNLSKIPEICNFGDVTLVPIESVLEDRIDDIVFKGNYSGDYIDETMCKFNETGAFIDINETNPIKSFEAAISIPDGVDVTELKMSNDLPVSVNSIEDESECFVDVYSVSGVCVKRNVLKTEASIGIEKGIYFIGNEKVIVR